MHAITRKGNRVKRTRIFRRNDPIPPRYERSGSHITTPANRTQFQSHSLQNVSPSVSPGASPESTISSDLEAHSVCSGRARHAEIPPHNYACFKQASIFLKAMIFTETPWPTEAEKRSMVLKAWTQAIEWRKSNFERVGISLDQNLTESVEPDRQTYAIVSCKLVILQFWILLTPVFRADGQQYLQRSKSDGLRSSADDSKPL